MLVSLIVPVLNEEDAIPYFYEKVKSLRQEMSMDPLLGGGTIEIVFVDDGSKDSTFDVIRLIGEKDPLVKLVSFTRNFGKEPALLAGLNYAEGDAVIPIDVDLQDPIELIPEMIRKFMNGADVVLAKRVDRHSDSFLKRKTAQWFYEIHNAISKPKLEENVGDFRLMSRGVVENVKLLQERNLFMKGLLSWVGGKKAEIVEYTRQSRVAGNSKFNFWKLWNLALDGLTGFSTVPLRVWSYFGGLVSLISFIYAIYLCLDKLIFGIDVPGYASIMVAILFFAGVQLVGIGVLGEYIGRIYIETKHRPRWIVQSTMNCKKKQLNLES